MTLLLLEGYDDRLAGLSRYISGGLRDTGAGRTGGLAARPNGQNFQLKPADETDTIIVGFAFKWDGNDQRESIALTSDGGTTVHLALWHRATGQIAVRRGAGSGAPIIGTTAIPTPLVAGVWHYGELKAKLHDAAGTVDVRIDEVNVLSLAGVDTKNGGVKTTWDRVVFNCFDTWVDDVYVANNAGAANNDFLGDIVVETVLPTGNGNSSVLVGSDGNSVNNYALVNEAVPDSSSYVGSGVTGDKDTYAFADLAHAAGAVVGVQTSLYAAKTDAGARTARAVVRSGGADYGGADVPLAVGFATYDEVRETDPATGLAWTVAGVNAAEFGFEARP